MIELFGHNNPTSEIQATVRLLFVAGLWAINHCESGRAATASSHRRGGLHHGNLSSPSSGGRKSQIKLSAEVVPSPARGRDAGV